MIGKFTVVGIGPGDPELITIKAARIIAAADVALYDAKDLGGNRFETGAATRGALAEAGGRLARPVGRGRGLRETGEPIGVAPVRSGEA